MAINIVSELISGKTRNFNHMQLETDRVFALQRLDENPAGVKTLKKIFYKILDKDEKIVNKQLFDMTYLVPDLKEETFYLLHNDYINPEDITPEQMNKMLFYTNWGKDYAFRNINKLIKKDECLAMYKVIFDYCRLSPDNFKMLIDIVLHQPNSDIKYDLNFLCATHNIELDENTLCGILYKNVDDYIYQQSSLFSDESSSLLSEMPLTEVLQLGYGNSKNAKYREIVNNNVMHFFNADKNEKLDLLTNKSYMFTKDILEKYKNLIELYRAGGFDYNLDALLSSIIDLGYESIFNDLLTDKVSFAGKGSTTMVYRIGDKVIKLSKKKHEIDSEKDFFLVAPTKTKILYKDDDPCLIIEEQDYLEKTYNGIPVNNKDITLFMDELTSMDYITTDPHTLKHQSDNFGFLKSYKDANLGDYNSPEEFPTWFKERPLVLYDTDLIYKKGKQYRNKMF